MSANSSNDFTNKCFFTQPTYLPWIGIFVAINWTDEYVFWDDVQYERKSWQNHNIIRNKNGGDLMLTVPIKKVPQQTPICDIQLEDKQFYRKHLKQIAINYGGEPFTNHVVGWLKTIYRIAVQDGTLYGLNETLTQALAQFIGLKTHFTRSANYGIGGSREERPIAFAKYLGATDYLTQEGTRPYFNQEAFDKANIKVHWLSISPPNRYSIVDYLCRLGEEKTHEIITQL